MINAPKVYIVKPMYGRPEALTNPLAAKHYARLCELFGYTVTTETYECGTLNFEFLSELYPFVRVTWFPEENDFHLEWSNTDTGDQLTDDGGTVCIVSSCPQMKDLFLKGDDSTFKSLVLDKCKGEHNESSVS